MRISDWSSDVCSSDLLNIFCSDECAWLSLSVPHHPRRSVGPNEGRKERSMTGLTALQVRNAKPGRYADGRGLYLLVRPSGSRSWVLRTQVDGKRRDRGLGSTATLSSTEERCVGKEGFSTCRYRWSP